MAAVFDYGLASGYFKGENVCQWRGRLAHLLPARSKPVVHHPAMPYAQVGPFLTQLRQQPGVAARALEFLILVAGRRNEVLGARWSELALELETPTWTVPASRMKTKKEHTIPLSKQAVALVRSLPKDSQGDEDRFVFIGTTAGAPLGNLAMFRVLKSLAPEATVHGFRSSFRDWAEEQSPFPAIVSELSLSHSVGNAVEKAYRRTQLLTQRAQQLQAWANFLYTPSAADNVTQLRQPKRLSSESRRKAGQ
jgi:integrase